MERRLKPFQQTNTSHESMPLAWFCFASPAFGTYSGIAGGSAPWTPGDYIPIAKYIVYPTETHIFYPSEPHIGLHSSIYIFSCLNQTNYITTQKFKQNLKKWTYNITFFYKSSCKLTTTTNYSTPWYLMQSFTWDVIPSQYIPIPVSFPSY